MNTALRLSAYGVALALVAGAGWGIGTAVDTFAGPTGARGGEDTAYGDTHSGTVAETTRIDQAEGLASSSGGYTLTPSSTTLTPGQAHDFAFRITGPDGTPVTRFDVEHSKRMHLIVVRRDTTGFQHLHPEMRADGTWTVPLRLVRAGSYRVFADFSPAGGQPQTLGVDLAVPGTYQPATHAPSRTATVDGYRVRLDGELVPGRTSKLTLTVTEDGHEVTDLQPYLGAYGHLVALRDGDLAYLHVHPDGEPGDGTTAAGPATTFYAEVPYTATYRLFLDFKHQGEVRTAEFTVPSAGATAAGRTPPPAADDGHGHADGEAGHG